MTSEAPGKWQVSHAELSSRVLADTRRPTKHGQGQLLLPLILFVIVLLLLILDIADDLTVGVSQMHIVVESLLSVAAAIGAVYFYCLLRALREENKEIRQSLSRARSEAMHWREREREVLSNLRSSIGTQLRDWGLSPKQMEIAFLLLNGSRLKEIAELKGSTFKSVKQQAHIIYRKAGLESRSELSAFFLGGLIDPFQP